MLRKNELVSVVSKILWDEYECGPGGCSDPRDGKHEKVARQIVKAIQALTQAKGRYPTD